MVNKVFLVGNLVADPEVKATPKGTYVANIRLATNTYRARTTTATLGSRPSSTTWSPSARRRSSRANIFTRAA